MPEGFLSSLRHSPEVQGLIKNAGAFAAARAAQGIGGPKGGALQGAAEAVTEDKSPVLGGIKGAIKGLFKAKGGAKRPTNIYEQNFIGVPVDFAYAAWREYAEFPKFMKGPESVSDQDEDGTTKWTAKIFLNRRSWTATVVEDIENYKIRWESEAPKGTVDGTVTFHEVSENLTLMVYVLEYRPKGFFERIGNLNRVVGRRARLDAKHFVRYVMMQNYEQEPADDQQEIEEGPADTESDGSDSSPAEQDQSAVGPEEPEEPEPVEDAPRRPRSPRSPRAPREPR